MKSLSSQSVVLIGGGGGVYRVASSLKHYTPNISTIQTMFDSGGHSKVLRDERGMLPPGDIRQAILALSADEIEPYLRVLLTHRFEKRGSVIDGATIGNLMLTALSEHFGGDIIKAIGALCKLCRVTGKVLPVSIDDAHLCVRLNDGTLLTNEGEIDTRSINDNRTITRAFLKPSAYIYLGAENALKSADKIVFCPGDFYTSIIPNALVKGFKEALASSKGKLILVVNLMTKKTETDGYTVSKFARTLLRYIGRKKFDVIIVNTALLHRDVLKKYEKERSYPVKLDKSVGEYAHRIITGNFVQQGEVLRHSSAVANAIMAG